MTAAITMAAEALLRSALEVSETMVTEAKAKNWEAVQNLDHERVRIFGELDRDGNIKQVGPAEGDTSGHAVVEDSIRQIMALDRELVELTKQAHAELAEALAASRRRNNALAQYREE